MNLLYPLPRHIGIADEYNIHEGFVIAFVVKSWENWKTQPLPYITKGPLFITKG